MAESSDIPVQSRISVQSQFLRRYATAIWLIYWLSLTVLLHLPKLPRMPIQISKKGLVAHFCSFAILTRLCVYSRTSRGDLTGNYIFKWTGILLLFGAISETLQPLSNRHRDWADFIANASGILTIMCYFYFKHANTSPPAADHQSA